MPRQARFETAASLTLAVLISAVHAPVAGRAAPCPARVIGIEAARANGSQGTWGEPCQTFYAADTLIREITVWRLAQGVSPAGVQLRILNTNASGVPLWDSVLFTSGVVTNDLGDFVHPEPITFDFDPPLALPHRGEYGFELLSTYSQLLVDATDVWSPNGYADGLLWFMRSPHPRNPPASAPNTDLAFRIVFLDRSTTGPVTFEGAVAGPCQIDLAWRSVTLGAPEATVLRRSAGTDWDSIATIAADGTGRFVFADLNVVPGTRYRYSLRANDCLFVGDTTVDVPGGFGVAFMGARPDTGRMRLSWTSSIPIAAPVYRRGIPTDPPTAVETKWQPIGRIQSDELQQLVFEDAHVLGGAGYEYALGVTECGREALLGRTRIAIPCGIETPALAAQPVTCGVRLAWSAADSALLQATLYRRTGDADWTPVGLVSTDSVGRGLYEDEKVTPGGRFEYRLGIGDCGSEFFSNEVAASVPAVQVTNATSRAEPDRVMLSWTVTGMTQPLATVYKRKLEPPDWRPLAQVAPDDSGRVRYEDTQVAGAERGWYAYRLGIVECGREYYFGETWLDTSLSFQLSLAGAQPVPSDNDLTVRFSLPDAARARIEVMDVAGRKIIGREVGELGRGDHVLNLTEGRGLASGVYLIRLIRGGDVRTARGVIVRQRSGRLWSN